MLINSNKVTITKMVERSLNSSQSRSANKFKCFNNTSVVYPVLYAKLFVQEPHNRTNLETATLLLCLN